MKKSMNRKEIDIIGQNRSKKKSLQVEEIQSRTSPQISTPRRSSSRQMGGRSRVSERSPRTRNTNLVEATFKTNKEILKIVYMFAGLFIALFGYIIYFNIVRAPVVINSSYNKLQDVFDEKIIRGKIYSSDGKLLADTKESSNGTNTRMYPYGHLFAHAVGFNTNGRSGLELVENMNLLTSHDSIPTRIYNNFVGEKNIGDNIISTLNTTIQRAAYNALGSKNGAVVVMEADTGKILAMVSKPNFNPNTISQRWDEITRDTSEENSVLINRATQGLYPPGSTFKVLTALEYMRENNNWNRYRYHCDGKAVFNSVTIRCAGGTAHGDLNLSTALAKSCNGAFADIGTQLDQDKFRRTCQGMLFNSSLPYNMVYNESQYSLSKQSAIHDIPQTVIGQGDTLVTPLHNLLIMSAIANGGNLMKPYLVDRVENCNGGIVKKYTPKSYEQLLTSDESARLTRLLKGVVNEGTASILQSSKYQVAGKTGTAEHGKSNKDHSWFTGFAPANNPKIVISVVVEEAGGSGITGTSVAKSVFESYFN